MAGPLIILTWLSYDRFRTIMTLSFNIRLYQRQQHASPLLFFGGTRSWMIYSSRLSFDYDLLFTPTLLTKVSRLLHLQAQTALNFLTSH